jgi:prefoldin subunit 5
MDQNDMTDIETLYNVIEEKKEALERAYTSSDALKLRKQIKELKSNYATLERLNRNKGEQETLF